MTSETTRKIKAYSADKHKQETLLALMDYYGKNSLEKISEEQAIAFLQKLERGEINI